MLARLPVGIQELARQKFTLWRVNTKHPSLDFKPLQWPDWSVRIGDHYRAVGAKDGDQIMWYWIGSHEEYNNLIGRR
ncbi:MAG: hypothetical protein LBK71_08240 [Verrucomicrobiales bacterium]|nr:hypothetical protein [Verrucomicrobiales bacterium]